MRPSKKLRALNGIVVAMVRVLVPAGPKADALGLAIAKSQMQSYQEGMRDALLFAAQDALSAKGIGDHITEAERVTLSGKLSNFAAGVVAWVPKEPEQ